MLSARVRLCLCQRLMRSSLQRHAGLNEKQMCRWIDGLRRGKGSDQRCTVLKAGGGCWGVGGVCWREKLDVRSVMQTSEPKVQQAAKTARQMPLEIQCDTSTGPTLVP